MINIKQQILLNILKEIDISTSDNKFIFKPLEINSEKNNKFLLSQHIHINKLFNKIPPYCRLKHYNKVSSSIILAMCRDLNLDINHSIVCKKGIDKNSTQGCYNINLKN